MTRRRFYAPPGAFVSDGAARVVRLAPEEARHLRDVLRMRAGDEAFVFDGEGGEFRCTVAETGRKASDQSLLEVLERVEPLRPESPLRLTLAVALLKGEKFDLVVQKATELGVERILPVLTKRADVRLRDAGDAARRAVRWQRLALEAAKQSGRARLPVVSEPIAFASLISGDAIADEEPLRVLFAERGGLGLAETFARLDGAPRVGAVVALVGPEGGWEEAELAEAAAARWLVVTLGGRTLRAETAAIAVTVLLQHLFGDLR